MSQSYQPYPGQQQNPNQTQPQPYQQQQQGYGAHNTTVVVNQPTGQAKPKRPFRTGLFGCFDDIPICCMATFCGPCYGCYLVTQADDSICLAICCQGWIVPVRSYVRGKLSIEGSVLNDFCTSICCNLCTTCQLGREIKQARSNGEWYAS